jgi:hypothetical protein
MPDNRGFYGFFQRKNRKNLQVRQAASASNVPMVSYAARL